MEATVNKSTQQCVLLLVLAVEAD